MNAWFYLLFCLFTPALHSQIPGTNENSAFIYQDTFSSGISQVISLDSTTNGSGSPGSPPPVTYGLNSATGSLNPTIGGSPGQIMRWQSWGLRNNPNQWYQLDVKALLPIQESLSLNSLDLFNAQRTRVGKTYTVSISVAGMPSYSTGATESGQVYLGLSALIDGTAFGFRSLAGYNSLTSPPISDPNNPGSLSEYNYNAWFLVNGNVNIANLAPSSPGTEIWLIDWIQTAEWSSQQIDQATMLVLSKPSLKVNQPIPSVYTGDPNSLPLLDLGFLNLYPGSLTVFQILDSNQNLIATLTVNNDTPNGAVNATHAVNHFLVPLGQYITQEGTYTFTAWTAEPFSDGLPSLNGVGTPGGYTWSPLAIPGTSAMSVQFTARVKGTIITN